MICDICPRKCNIDRSKTVGFCGMTNTVKLAKADVFMWEEPCISGTNGSGAVFFSGCNLRCCFCQNYQISNQNFGKEISTKRLAQIFKELEEKGVHNINLVSPSHFANQIIEALEIYRPNIPIVYNSNGYESVETIKKLKNYVDIYLVDLKFCSSELSQKYCKASNYFDVATSAIKEMISQKPKVIVQNGIMKQGVIIRHLIMPSQTADSLKILQWIADNPKENCLVSLMCQYTPYFNAKNFPEINRKLKPIEYKIVLTKANELGLTNGYAQDMSSATEDFIPLWDLKGV